MEDLFDFEKYEFGIIDNFEEAKKELMDISTFYDPKKYNCVKLLEDFWWNFYDDTKEIETLNLDEELKMNKGFDVFGGSVVPPSNLEKLIKIIEKQIANKEKVLKDVKDVEDAENRFDKEFEEVLKTIKKALENNKYVIFYGN